MRAFRFLPRCLGSVLAALLAAPPAAAQDSNFALQPRPAAAAATGWTFTPSLLYQTAWDDNVLLRGRGDQSPGDVLNLVNPRADLHFLGRKGMFDLNYDGGFLFYRRLTTLNSYDQHGNVQARRHLTPHVVLFVENSAAIVPTTELVDFIAVPFIRTGSKLDALRGGVEAALSKFTTITATYEFQWVQFNRDSVYNAFLRGGHSNGGTFLLRRAVSERTTILGTYDIRHAIVADGGTFDVQNADVGIERKLSDATRIFAAGGVSYLGVSDRGPARTGPSLRAGLTHAYERATVDLSYARSYVPAFGFGGTYQNQEFSARVHVPLARRLYVQSSASYRTTDPLIAGDLSLKSLWIEGVAGYAVQPWLHLEAFYSGTHQDTQRAGGQIDRSRIGFQISTTTPMRLR